MRGRLRRRLTEAVLIWPFWCCFCLLPTPDGYHNKWKRCQSKFASDMQGKRDAIRKRSISSTVISFPLSCFQTHTWNSRNTVNSTRSHRGMEMEFIRSNYFRKWIRWEGTFQRLSYLPADMLWHIWETLEGKFKQIPWTNWWDIKPKCYFMNEWTPKQSDG